MLCNKFEFYFTTINKLIMIVLISTLILIYVVPYNYCRNRSNSNLNKRYKEEKINDLVIGKQIKK